MIDIDVEAEASTVLGTLGHLVTLDRYRVLRRAQEATVDALTAERIATAKLLADMDAAMGARAPKVEKPARKQRADKGKPRAPKVAP